MAALVASAERSRVPACVQLDHVDDLELVESACELGAGAVMADGSRLPFDENVELVREARAVAARVGADVEAELGHVEGDENVAIAVARGALTDAGEALEFVERSRAACLAVSIGNVHGRYRDPPRLDWARLAAIRARVPVPLSLHGASGLDEADVRRAVALGIAKVNVNTELRERYFEATASALESTMPALRLLELHEAQVAAVGEVVDAKLDAFEGDL